jgi:hypothetical protein
LCARITEVNALSGDALLTSVANDTLAAADAGAIYAALVFAAIG